MKRRDVITGWGKDSVLGSQASWGRVGHHGAPFAPAASTYPGAKPAAWMSLQDSGTPVSGRELANLHLLVAAAVFEAGFVGEAGPLTTWSN